MLQLVYLGSGEILRYSPDEGDLLATERKVKALWEAISAGRAGDWRPSPAGCATGVITTRTARREGVRRRIRRRTRSSG